MRIVYLHQYFVTPEMAGGARSYEMARRLATAVARAGLREYYDPYTGNGMGARDFSWSALVMEMIDPDPAAASSHVRAR